MVGDHDGNQQLPPVHETDRTAPSDEVAWAPFVNARHDGFQLHKQDIAMSASRIEVAGAPRHGMPYA